MKKSLIFITFCAMISLFGYANAEQGDYATLGFNTPGGYSFWRVDSDGHFKPGYASTYDIGTSALPIRTIYAGTISGAAITSGGALAASTLDTGQGANELYDMNQNVLTTSDVTFKSVAATYGVTAATVTTTGAIKGATVEGTTSITSPLYIATGAIRNYSRTKAQINAIATVAIGDEYYCSDCTAVTKCVSTGTVVGSFVKIDDKTAVCD